MTPSLPHGHQQHTHPQLHHVHPGQAGGGQLRHHLPPQWCPCSQHAFDSHLSQVLQNGGQKVGHTPRLDFVKSVDCMTLVALCTLCEIVCVKFFSFSFRLRKQLVNLYIVHPTFWVKTMVRLARPIIRWVFIIILWKEWVIMVVASWAVVCNKIKSCSPPLVFKARHLSGSEFADISVCLSRYWVG